MEDRKTKCELQDFVIRSHDFKGRTIRICFDVPPLLNQAFDDVIKSRKLSFQTKDDAFRWSIFRGVKALESMQTCGTNLPILQFMVSLARTQLEMKMYVDFFTQLDSILLELMTSGFQELRAHKVAQTIEQLILCMPSSSDRVLYLSELRRRWGHLLVGHQKSSPNGYGNGGRPPRRAGGESR